LERGSSSHRFPAAPHSDIRQDPKQSSEWLSREVDDCGEVREKRWLPPHSKALRATVAASLIHGLTDLSSGKIAVS
jgi:hypothetical protein